MIRRASSSRSARSGGGGRLIIALAIAAFALFSFLASREYNPVTGKKQYIGLTKEQEIQIGQQAVPQMLQEMGPLLNDEEVQSYVQQVGNELVQDSVAADTEWVWGFHVIDNPDLVNAFALPGGQVFITTALLSRLETEAQLAGVLGHEITHVLARHGAEQMAKQQLTQGLLQAVAVASSPQAAQSAALFAQLINMSYGREDETESDMIGIEIMSCADYDPEAMAEVMQILAEASGGSPQPEFFSTHPNPENRIERIHARINELESDGQITRDELRCQGSIDFDTVAPEE
jgi:predicted Zn-dependent protease